MERGRPLKGKGGGKRGKGKNHAGGGGGDGGASGRRPKLQSINPLASLIMEGSDRAR